MNASFTFSATPQQQHNGQWSIQLPDAAIEWCAQQTQPIIIHWPSGQLDRLTSTKKTVSCPADWADTGGNTITVKLHATYPVDLAKLPAALAVALAADNQSYLYFSLLSPGQQQEAADEVADAKRPLAEQKKVRQLLKRLHRT